ncbi:MAG: hypothetical protein H6728_07855 [Myxococcales bacterium]|nr:hypothetical protein [Myxococcales bacterium]MCB9642975.1 hypothetical protein [Myxococcales bacterium]
MRAHWLWWMVSCWVVVSVALVWGSRTARCEREQGNFVGAYKCRGCHEKEHKTWAASSHAKAYAILPEKDRNNAQCLRCHSVGTASHLQGVQCESCHGAGKYYSIPEVMVDSNLARAVGLKVVKGVQGCASCHVGHTPKLRKFDYDAMWKKIAHGK